MKTIITTALLTLATMLANAQTVIYVKPDGTGDGSSWTNACNIDTAIVVGASLKPVPTGTNVQIWVQMGTHYPKKMLRIPAGVKMYGGFKGTETLLSQRDSLSNATIIDAQKKYGSVIRMGTNSELNGFVIQNGNAQHNPQRNGAGVWADENCVIANCVIAKNTAQINGGGLYAKGDIRIINSTIEDNTADNFGNNVYGCCAKIEGGNIKPFICKPISTKDQSSMDTKGFEPLTVSAFGSGTLSYQWYSNTTNSTVGGTPVGINSPSFIPPSITTSALYYYVVVSNAYGKDTSNVSGLYTVKPLILDYTGSPQEVTLHPGTYVIECWGAQGSSGYGNLGIGGYGGYTKGTIELLSSRTFYVFVGGVKPYVWDMVNTGDNVGNNGGEASDIRLVKGSRYGSESLLSRIMVAPGGGGGGSYETSKGGGAITGAHAGGLTGSSGNMLRVAMGFEHTPPTGGTQNSGGNAAIGTSQYWMLSGVFGRGGRGYIGGGGDGYYGGGGGSYNHYVASSGGGGSAFISGHAGCNAVNASGTHTGQPNHYSGMVFTETVMIAGNASMPNPRGTGNITGNSGNGFVQISRLSLDKPQFRHI